MIEFINPYQIILREHFTRQFLYDSPLLFGSDQQFVVRVNAHEAVLAVVKVIRPLAQVKVRNIDQTDFVGIILWNVVRDSL